MKVILKSETVSIEKEVLTDGIDLKKPTERSKCRFKIEKVDIAGSSINDEAQNELLRSDYLSPGQETSVIIGDASSILDESMERIIQTMSTCEKSFARINLKNRLAEGYDSVLISFEITLIDCEFYNPIWEWTPYEKYNVALIYKEMGIGLHKLSRTIESFKKFSRSCKILITLEPMEDNDGMEPELKINVDNLRKTLYNNIAECHLIRRNYELAITLCDKVLGRDDKNVKALYRRAVAHEGLKDYENAMNFMNRVVILEPKNLAAREKLIIYKKNVGEANKNYENIVKKMFKI